MAQTKRKKRGKHRGNAIGMVESRGRSGSKPADGAARRASNLSSSTKGGARKPAPLKPPSWKSAAMKAGFGCLILFIFFNLVGKNTSVGSALAFSCFAFVLYVPIMYWTDSWIYKRKMNPKKS
ncbi:MAG: hypothetical protein QOF76_4810 [Solirubrobacteraceae bacterium]|jgi:hypothetical protein|nr:hypothetical protein [Solirubrobacteraceae bacterium]